MGNIMGGWFDNDGSNPEKDTRSYSDDSNEGKPPGFLGVYLVPIALFAIFGYCYSQSEDYEKHWGEKAPLIQPDTQNTLYWSPEGQQTINAPACFESQTTIDHQMNYENIVNGDSVIILQQETQYKKETVIEKQQMDSRRVHHANPQTIDNKIE